VLTATENSDPIGFREKNLWVERNKSLECNFPTSGVVGSRYQTLTTGNLTRPHSAFYFLPGQTISRQGTPPGDIKPAKGSHWSELGHTSIPKPITEAQDNVALSLVSFEPSIQ
jgi:hypothetical protein